MCGFFRGFAGVLLNTGGEFVGTAEKTHAYIIFLNERHLLAEVLTEKLHKKLDFGFWTAPVFDGKGVEGEGLDVEARACFDGGARGLRAGAVTGDARKMALLGPTAVAVHDDGDVTG